MQDGLHQLAVVPHDRALAGGEGVRLCPAESDADAQVAGLGGVVDAARIVGHIEAGNAQRAARAGDRHQRIEHRCGTFHRGVRPVAAGFEADAIDGAIHLRDAENLVDLLGERGRFLQIHGFAAEAPRLRQTLGNQVADDDHRGAQQVAGGRARQADRSGAGNVDDRFRDRRPQ